jgi:hypothetical protein
MEAAPAFHAWSKLFFKSFGVHYLKAERACAYKPQLFSLCSITPALVVYIVSP